MTPLAQRLVGELILPAHKSRAIASAEARQFMPRHGAAPLMDAKFFDLRSYFSGVPRSQPSFDIEKSFPPRVCQEFYRMNEGESDLAFYPAEIMWFEITDDMALYIVAEKDSLSAAAIRAGISDHANRLEIEEGSYAYARMFLVVQEGKRIAIDIVGMLLLKEDRSNARLIGIDETRDRLAKTYGSGIAEDMMGTMRAFATLALIGINSSRYAVSNVIVPGERDRQRSLRGKSLVGKFPLRAYSEIKLIPGETLIPEPQHNMTTGERAQHFVRAHLRRYKRTGKTVLVTAHHRGNPALGMCQHRYKVEKPE